MLTNQLFYRKYGVRYVQQLMNAPAFDLATLDLPMKSIYHYVTYDGVDNGPPSDDYLFRNIKKPIVVGHITDLVNTLGNPRKVALNINQNIRDYQNANRRTRPLRNIVLSTKDPSALVVFNYCLINKNYKYIRSFFTEYYKWHNTFSTVIDNIKKVADECDSNHFLLTSIPNLLPGLTQLTMASDKEMTQGLLKVFNSEESYFLLELWKWLGNNRGSSVFSQIPNNKIHLVNIIYLENGKWSVLNLGYLNSFRETTESDFVVDVKAPISALQVQKRFLKYNMSIMELRSVATNVEIVDEKKSVITGNILDAEEAVVPTEDDDEVQVDEPNTEMDPVLKSDAKIIVDTTQTADDEEDLSDEEKLSIRNEEDEKLDLDLAFLNDISTKQENAQEVTSEVAYSDIINEQELPLEDNIIQICDKLADDGLLSAGEYRKFTKLANSYKEIISPDGVTPLSEFIKIDPESLLIKETANMPDSGAVLDKTMLKSSLVDFDSRYIKDVLAKDTANAVLAVQKAGIAVTSYRVEKVHDILGGFEMHTLKLTPVEGLPSTLRFKLPIIDTTGNFMSNNVLYKLRRQRIDVPIRKTAPTRVALTSYYGKIFINRSKKKSSDYNYWLQCTIMDKGVNKDDNDITNILPADVFDNSLSLPRAYSATSMCFRGFMCRGYSCIFDRKQTLEHYPKHILDMFEIDGSIVFGVNDKSTYLIMDKNGSVYTTNEDELVLFGTFEQFLNIPLESAPVDYVDVVVFGKEVPIGVMLGYKLGFSNLMSLLRVTPRRVTAGSRLNMQPNEYALAFSDETLIFSKDDKVASLILSSFNQYNRAIRMFSVYSFDKRGVYLNLLESAQLGVRYLREIDHMYNMFIDPITRDLLIEMKEPVTFQGLLFRSCELLSTDQYPDELDPKYMRIKGYERLSGAVYTELVQAIRVHNGKMGKKNAAIELNPYSVWKRISEDPSKSQVSQINPVKELKESEAVTYAGTGGRNKRSMTAHTRMYHKNDMGTISESTVDSSDVAINVFTSADPQFSSLRGMSKPYDFNTTGATALVSTSMLLAPGSYNDDQLGPVYQ